MPSIQVSTVETQGGILDGRDKEELAFAPSCLMDAGHPNAAEIVSNAVRLQSERIAALELALKPFASVADQFRFAIGPDGHDDGLTVVAEVACRPGYEATLSTADFSHARRAYDARTTPPI